MGRLVWLITGCSSGLGAALVRSILKRGDVVIATARQVANIPTDIASHAAVTCFTLDITSPQTAVNELVEQARLVHGRIDVLVNNAGFIQLGLWEDLDDTDWIKQFDVNVFGQIRVTKAILPSMRQNRSGTIVFINSLNGWVGPAGFGAYSGSKHALAGAAESLSHEVESFGVKTLIIEPGRTRTSLLSSGNFRIKTDSDTPSDDPAKRSDYKRIYEGVFPGALAIGGTEPGDPVKIGEVVVDFVRGEGVAQGVEAPLRLFVGEDSWTEVGEKLRAVEQGLKRWESVTRGVNID